MIACEALLLTTLLALLVCSSYTDFRNGMIHNRLIGICVVIASAINAVYYIAFSGKYISLFAVNTVLLVIVAVIFYVYHLWAAGDSKLLMTAALCIPGRFYSFWQANQCVGFLILVITFSAAFLYILTETIVLGIQNHNLLQIAVRKVNFKRAALVYVSMVSASILLTQSLTMLFPHFFEGSMFLPATVNFLVIVTLVYLSERISWSVIVAYCIISWMLIGTLAALKILPLSFTFDYRSWLLVLAVLMMRAFAGKYNYAVIPTQEVKSGQILAATTVAAFSSSRVKGLPCGMTEDLCSRLTEEEAASVRRWENSALGKPYVVIVRKIPFAIFISMGIILFLVLGVTMR